MCNFNKCKYQELIYAYQLAVDMDDEKHLKCVVDELRTFEREHKITPYVIYGVGYVGLIVLNDYEQYIHKPNEV